MGEWYTRWVCLFGCRAILSSSDPPVVLSNRYNGGQLVISAMISHCSSHNLLTCVVHVRFTCVSSWRRLPGMLLLRRKPAEDLPASNTHFITGALRQMPRIERAAPVNGTNADRRAPCILISNYKRTWCHRACPRETDSFLDGWGKCGKRKHKQEFVSSSKTIVASSNNQQTTSTLNNTIAPIFIRSTLSVIKLFPTLLYGAD